MSDFLSLNDALAAVMSNTDITYDEIVDLARQLDAGVEDGKTALFYSGPLSDGSSSMNLARAAVADRRARQ